MDLSQLSISQLAALARLDRATTKKRLAVLTPVKVESKKTLYDTYDALRVLFGSDDGESPDLAKQMAEEELRYEKAKVEKLNLEIQKLKGENIPIVEVARNVGSEYSNVRARILSIPSRCAKDLALENSPSLVKERLDEEISEALAELTADSIYEEKANHVEQTLNNSETDTSEDVESAPEA